MNEFQMTTHLRLPFENILDPLATHSTLFWSAKQLENKMSQPKPGFVSDEKSRGQKKPKKQHPVCFYQIMNQRSIKTRDKLFEL